MKSSIFALLIGINDYSFKPLRGCINDVLAIEKLLQQFEVNGTELKIKKLLNRQATRSNIIKGFSHFEGALVNDICLLYYSGHGSFAPAPKEFITSTNRFHQSLVCSDSREKGGRDLMDKELSYLIWKYTTGLSREGFQFILITDSCHSGTVMRAANDDGNLVDKMAPELQTSVPASDYYGFNEEINGQRGYRKDESKGVFFVEGGPHIHLAASQDQQTAKENIIDGQYRGIFTYSLLKSLNKSNGLINYSELIRQTELNIKSLITEQVPVLNINLLPSSTALNVFLRREGVTKFKSNQIYYDAKKGWCLNAGSLKGVSKRDRVIGENFSTVVTEVFPEESAILIKPELNDISQTINVRILYKNITGFSFDSTLSDKIKMLLLEGYIENRITEFLLDAKDESDYHIRSYKNLIFVSALFSDEPMFKEAVLNNGNDAALFLENLNKFSKCNRFLKLQNPGSSISCEEFKLFVKRTIEPIDYNCDDFKNVDDISKPISLSYYFKNGNKNKPAIQLQIENTGNRELWFYPFYIGFDFSIDNAIFRSFSLEKKGRALLTINKQGAPDIIKLKLEEKYRNLGYNSISEHIKIIVSAKPLGNSFLEAYHQSGIELSKNEFRLDDKDLATRGVDDDDEETHFIEDWTGTTITLDISYPEP